MTLPRFLKAFFVTFILFTLLDAFWHGGIMADFYNERLMMFNSTLDGPPTVSPFILFIEAINAAALSYFVLSHQQTRHSYADAAWVGVLLGFTVTGTVNFLNHALMPFWDIVLALVDTAWGTVVGLIGGLTVAAVCPAPQHKGLFGWLRRR